jgi:hypothetical protein
MTFENPLRPGLPSAILLLRISLLLMALGYYVALTTRAGSHFGSIALFKFGVPHDTILAWEHGIARLLVVLAIFTWFRFGCWAALLMGLVIMAESVAGVFAGGFPFFEHTPWAWALRFGAPFGLAAWMWKRNPQPQWTIRGGDWVLRLAIAAVFAIHGLEAFWKHPQFIDLFIGSANAAGCEIRELAVVRTLVVIAVVDLAVAAMVLVWPRTPLLIWCACWGLVTALSRPMAYGFASYPEVLIRAPHYLAPLALMALHAAGNRRSFESTAKDQRASHSHGQLHESRA